MFIKFQWRSIFRPVLIFLFVMSFYQVLVSGGVLPASDGVSLIQNNIVKAQRYVYQDNSDLKMVVVGSSLTANLNVKDIGEGVKSIALGGGASQTGLEIVKINRSKPPIVLVEINDTITRKVDLDLVNSLYNPVFYWLRLYLPMMREEYRPVSVFVDALKNRSKSDIKLSREELDKREARNLTPELSKKGIQMAVDVESKFLSAKDTESITKEAEFIKNQIAEIQKNSGTKVVLFDIPQESVVDAQIRRKQVRELVKKLFDAKSFEWLPPPPPREWRTNDGIHLIRSDARDFAEFLRDKLLR
jgi:regulator of RNase E activity RraB